MTDAALKIDADDAPRNAHLCVVQNNAILAASIPANSLKEDAAFQFYTAWLAGVLITLQFLDGILTYAGISTFGIRAEGNPLLRSLMSIVGIVPAIAITKVLCVTIIVVLCAQAHKISWLPTALTCIAGLYALGAVVPWSWLLIAEFFA